MQSKDVLFRRDTRNKGNEGEERGNGAAVWAEGS